MSRGGKRQGAGRPTKDGIARKRQTVVLREDLLAELTRQATELGCSLSDRVNALLAEQLTAKAQQTPTPAPNPAGKSPAAVHKQQPPQLAKPAPTPGPAVEESEPIPSYRELDELVRKWQLRQGYINRRSQKIQYWRKAYRQDKGFRTALNKLATLTHSGIRELLLDDLLPIGSHKEVLALAELPRAVVKLTIVRFLRGEGSLKRALGTEAETFRQLIIGQVSQTDPLYRRYYFFEEL